MDAIRASELEIIKVINKAIEVIKEVSDRENTSHMRISCRSRILMLNDMIELINSDPHSVIIELA